MGCSRNPFHARYPNPNPGILETADTDKRLNLFTANKSTGRKSVYRIRIRSDTELFAGSGIRFLLTNWNFYLITMFIYGENSTNCQRLYILLHLNFVKTGQQSNSNHFWMMCKFFFFVCSLRNLILIPSGNGSGAGSGIIWKVGSGLIFSAPTHCPQHYIAQSKKIKPAGGWWIWVNGGIESEVPVSGMSDFHLICSWRRCRFFVTWETEDTEKTDPTPLPRRSRVPGHNTQINFTGVTNLKWCSNYKREKKTRFRKTIWRIIRSSWWRSCLWSESGYSVFKQILIRIPRQEHFCFKSVRYG